MTRQIVNSREEVYAFLEKLLVCDDFDSVRDLMLESLPSIIGGKFSFMVEGLYDDDPSQWSVRTYVTEAYSKDVMPRIEMHNKYSHQNPVLEYCYLEKVLDTPIQLEQMLGKKDFLKSDLYKHFHQPCRMEHWAIAELYRDPFENFVVMYTVARDSAFSEEQMEVFAYIQKFIKPSLVRIFKSHRESLYIKTLSEVAEDSNVGYLVVGKTGALVGANEKANGLISKHFHASSTDIREYQKRITNYFLAEVNVAGSDDFEQRIEKVWDRDNNQTKLFTQCVWSIHKQTQIIVMWERKSTADQKENVDLTRREREVLQWVIAAKTNSEIATILGISKRTVDNHVSSLLFKHGVNSRMELV